MMAKVIRTITLDYDVVQGFKLHRSDEKLSTVVNSFLQTYVNANDKATDEEVILKRRKELLKKQTEINSKLLSVNIELQGLNETKKVSERIKEKYWHEVINAKFPGYAREKYDRFYAEKWEEKATRHSEK